MSGTFDNIDVPPSLVSFAVGYELADRIISPELKVYGSSLVLLKATKLEDGLIDNDMWLRMLKCRNALAHDYDGEYAMAVYQQIITEYYPLFVQFKDNIAKYDFGHMNEDSFN